MMGAVEKIPAPAATDDIGADHLGHDDVDDKRPGAIGAKWIWQTPPSNRDVVTRQEIGQQGFVAARHAAKVSLPDEILPRAHAYGHITGDAGS